MPVFDYQCEECGLSFEAIAKFDEIVKCPKCFDADSKKIFINAPTFKLKYNPKTDMVDWNGNRSQYWDEYNKMKEEGLKPRIPALDGDQK